MHSNLPFLFFFFLRRWLGPLFQNSVADCNVSVREKALDAVLAFQRASDAADASRLSACWSWRTLPCHSISARFYYF
jgi:hypothetical protein